MSDRPSPDIDRGGERDLSDRAQRLVDRAQVTDRRSRFRHRLGRIRAQRSRRQVRRQTIEVVGTFAAVAVAVVLGAALEGWAGAAIGLAVAVAVLGARRLLLAWAPRRGASAWDWQAQRYRVLGDPSKTVQELDRPPEEHSRR
ncbi:MAG: hypothetical protein R3343_07205 [Nitriliruptorales bacterium]|nr:hypothetical protein [Nitriliruptorales bacterium]